MNMNVDNKWYSTKRQKTYQYTQQSSLSTASQTPEIWTTLSFVQLPAGLWLMGALKKLSERKALAATSLSLYRRGDQNEWLLACGNAWIRTWYQEKHKAPTPHRASPNINSFIFEVSPLHLKQPILAKRNLLEIQNVTNVVPLRSKKGNTNNSCSV